tara:strand:- start:924 stop:1319 length:396 start_codon:yes stop_codon:yes gene_type:complete
MKCAKQYISPGRYRIIDIRGIKHFLNEKTIYDSVHPIWILVIAFISFYFTSSSMERFLIITFSFYSFLLEMLNSSIEITNDRWGCEYNENTKIAKELSASVTALSRFPLFALSSIILYRNWKSCNKLTACD